MQQKNRIINQPFENCDLPSGCAQLIIADPPYFKVKGGFDFVFKDFQAYLEKVEQWAQKCAELLAPNGSLFWWGHAKKIAYSQVILDKYFNLLNSIVWEKIDAQTRKSSSYRIFTPVSERLLFYSSKEENTLTPLEQLRNMPGTFPRTKAYMREQRKACMEHNNMQTLAQFERYISDLTRTAGVAARHYFGDSQYLFPTSQNYASMKKSGFWEMPFEQLRGLYEEDLRSHKGLLEELEGKRRYFDQQFFSLRIALETFKKAI